MPDGRLHGHFTEKFGIFKSWMSAEKIAGRESGREPCSQTPTYDIPATAGKQATTGMLATARIQQEQQERQL